MIETFFEMRELTINKETINKIIRVIENNRAAERHVKMDSDTAVRVVYTDCSNGSIGDACDASYNVESDVIFLDKDGRNSLEKCLSHELIHLLQKRLYLFLEDVLEEPYEERWTELQAYELEAEVAGMLEGNIVSDVLITDDENEIDDYIDEQSQKYNKEKAKKRKGIPTKLSVVDQYFEDNEDKHREDWY